MVRQRNPIDIIEEETKRSIMDFVSIEIMIKNPSTSRYEYRYILDSYDGVYTQLPSVAGKNNSKKVTTKSQVFNRLQYIRQDGYKFIGYNTESSSYDKDYITLQIKYE